MAHIKINSKIVIEACEKYLDQQKRSKFPNRQGKLQVSRIKKMAEYALDCYLDFFIDSNDYYLIQIPLPNPATYSQDKP